MLRFHRGSVLAAVVLAGLFAASCSDSEGSEASASSDATASEATAPALSGEPIKIGFIGTTEAEVFAFPQTVAAAKARVEAANSAGGLDGRPIELIACNDANDPNKAAACVREVVDAGVVAVIGGLSQQGDTITAGLEQAGVIYTAHRPLGPGDYTSSISFPLSGGSATVAAGLGATAVEGLDCENIFTITGDAPANRAGTEAFDAAVRFVGGEIAGAVVTPSNTTDYSPAGASAAAKDADCILLMMTPPEMARATPAVRQAVPSAKVMATGGAVPPQVVEALGASADGMLLADPQLPVNFQGNASIDRFRHDMETFASDAGTDSFGLGSWLGVDVLLKVAEGLNGDIDADSIRTAYDGMATIDTGGIMGEFGFTDPSPFPERPRQFNRTYILFEVSDGDYLIDDPSFADATAALGG